MALEDDWGFLARFIYKRVNLKFLRPVVGSLRATDNEEGHSNKRVNTSPLVHYSYAKEKDFFICPPHASSLANILGEGSVQVLEMFVVGHFESHFSLANSTCEWHDVFRKTMSSL